MGLDPCLDPFAAQLTNRRSDMAHRAALNIPGSNFEIFFFKDEKYVLVWWTPGGSDTIIKGPTKFADDITALKDSGFTQIDSVLPKPGKQHGTYFCRALNTHSSTPRYVWSVSFSHESTHIVSGSSDLTTRIWDVRTGTPVGELLMGHTGGILSVVFSHDSRYIVSGLGGSTIRIWDARTGVPIDEPLRGHTGVVWSVVLSPDRIYLVSGSEDGTICVWKAPQNFLTQFSNTYSVIVVTRIGHYAKRISSHKHSEVQF